MSVKIIAVSHGRFSEGLVDSVQMLAGAQENLTYYGLFPEETVDDLREKLKKELENTPEDMEVLFLSDVFHGSPFNTIVDLMREFKFHHVTGINLSLAVVAMMDRYMDMSAEEIGRHLVEESAGTIQYVNDMFSPDVEVEDEEDEEE